MRSTRPVPLTVESIPSLTWLQPNAGAHLLPEAGATQERTLEAVRCPGRAGGFPPGPPQVRT
jgi:hypothetical protein